MELRHRDGALWIDGALEVWLTTDIGLDPESKYHVICADHGQCVGVDTKAGALSCSLNDFCEVHSGQSEWCRTCGQEVDPYGRCEGHDVGPGTLAEYNASRESTTS